METRKLIVRANEIADPYGLKAEIFEGLNSVGVSGDARAYLPILCLSGPFPGNEKLDEVSNLLTNELPISRVTFELAHR